MSKGANGQDVDILILGGKPVEVDVEISDIVYALDYLVGTVASCSGHSHRPAVIALADGREVIIARNFEEARRIDALFPTDINGDTVERISDEYTPGSIRA